MCLSITLSVLMLAQSAPYERPAALLGLEDARRAIRTARVVWTERKNGEAVSAKVEFRSGQGACVSRPLPMEAGASLEVKQLDLRRAGLLYDGDAIYTHSPGDVLVGAFVVSDPVGQGLLDHRLRDIRSLGMNPGFSGSPSSLDDAVSSFPRRGIVRRYNTVVRDKLHVVTATLETGRQIVWFLNPEKQWNPEKVEYWNGSEFLQELVLSLECADGIWFPRTATLKKGPGREVATTWTVESVEFNRAEHPQTLTLADIGVEPGMTLAPQGGPDVVARFGVGDEPRVWDGEKFIRQMEFRDACRAGLVALGPTLKAVRESSGPRGGDGAVVDVPGPAAKLERELSGKWVQFVEGSILRFAFSDDQAERARAILKNCQERGKRLLDRERSTLERAAQLDARQTPAESKGEQRDLLERVRSIEAEIDEIFQNDLRPRVEKLATREQRKVAEDK